MAEAPLVPGLAALLEARREVLNAAYQSARASLPRLDQVDVLGFVAATLGPIAAVLPAARAGPVLEALFSVALPLLGRDLLGGNARTPYMQQGWERLLPGWPRLLAQQPRRLARAVSNALYHLGRQPGANPERWIELMRPLGERAETADELLAAGQVAAWRSGLPQYREAALAIAAQLPPALAGPALGASAQSDPTARDALLARLAADPWTDTEVTGEPTLTLLTVGGFRGLGGPFVSPPRVLKAGPDLRVQDAQAVFHLRADRFGQALLRQGPARPDAELATHHWRWRGPAGNVRLLRDGRVNWGSLQAHFPHLAEADSAAWDGHTLIVGHPLSHALFLVAPVARSAP